MKVVRVSEVPPQNDAALDTEILLDAREQRRISFRALVLLMNRVFSTIGW